MQGECPSKLSWEGCYLELPFAGLGDSEGRRGRIWVRRGGARLVMGLLFSSVVFLNGFPPPAPHHIPESVWGVSLGILAFVFCDSLWGCISAQTPVLTLQELTAWRGSKMLNKSFRN